MKICLVSQEYPPETARGGIGTQTYAKAHGLSALGHQITVLSAAKEMRSERQDGAVRLIRIPGFHGQIKLFSDAASWLTYSAAVAVEFERLHAADPFDLVDFPEWGGEGFVHLLNQTEWNHVPSVVQVHGPIVMFSERVGWPEQDSDLYRVATLMEGTSWRRADAVYASSRHSADWCARFYGPRTDVPVLHTGVDTDLFQPLPRPGGEYRPTVLFVGRVDHQKGADLVFESVVRLAEEIPGLRLRLVGGTTTSLARELRAKAQRLDLGTLIEEAGYVKHEDLPAEFAAADVMAAPSKGEGGPGFVYLEAMACGLPVIGCREGGVGESLKDGVTGLLVGEGQQEELTAALRKILTNEPLRKEMGLRAREHVLRTARTRDCIRGIEQFYRNVLERAAVSIEAR